MHLEKIKAEIRINGMSFVKIGQKLGLTPQTVGQVAKERRSARVEKEIAEIIGKPLHIVFPKRYEDPNAKAS